MDDTQDQYKAFAEAMQRYHQYDFYQQAGVFVSVIVVLLQAITFFQVTLTLCQEKYSANGVIVTALLILAYLLADFVGGLVHLYMDNNTYYQSVAGPFIAAFHLHHKQPVYKKRHPMKVYFDESGTKWWLAGYLILLMLAQFMHVLSLNANMFLVAFSLFSSVAELSHYWCHNATNENKIIRFLQRYRILLTMKHHRHHHLYDNNNYAFLNGITDPLINLIAKYYYQGYKNHADLHALAYVGEQTDNR